MTPADAISFLQRKFALLIENTWSAENEKVLNDYWDKVRAGFSDSITLADLQKLDRSAEKIIKQFVLREDRADLRRSLLEEFGLSRLTAAELKAVAIPPRGD